MPQQQPHPVWRPAAGRGIRVAVACSGFKEALSPEEVAAAIAEGVRRAGPGAVAETVPVPDGGEGTAAILARATGGRLLPVTVPGPLGAPVTARFALLGGDGPRTAVVEMAAAAGLRLVPRDRRDPGVTTTFGVGRLVSAALDAGARRVLIGCGDSGTCDGGAGALCALGARLLDARGGELPPGGAALARLDRLDPAGLDRRLAGAELRVAVDPHTVLCGPRGAARVYGPQKGAGPAGVRALAAGLENWARVLARDLPGRPPGAGGAAADLRLGPGTGASGGLAAGLAALGARLVPRFELLLRHVDLDGPLARADVVITAEGSLDERTFPGKTPAEVARRARRLGRPVIALAGSVGPGWGPGEHRARECGIDVCVGVLPGPLRLEEALARSAGLVTDAAAGVTRLLLLGGRLAVPAAGGQRRREAK
ncbi:glycerate kinase [Streptomyces aidingensis]|uniref:Glycerate kinase n=1 Tax=Streptomyces aidingensis TaxID=910347 RepID=A0A1I1SLG8_9ACTN|nr:glycerate kinase [Streptomyces aidingensis]SFD47325.1 glycerate kinase [Streptomyces aidingensis]